MTDWVYEEEFDLRDAFRWSPDGSKIAYWRFDMTGLGTYFLVNDTDSLYPHITPIQYPKVGTRNSAVRDRKSTRLNSSHQIISYAVFCLKKKTTAHRIRLKLTEKIKNTEDSDIANTTRTQ